MTSIATSKNFKTLAKMGYSARGIVYLVIGGLALLAGFGRGGKTTDSKGAIVEIMQQPFGNFLLAILILGLFGYVAWRFTQAIRDTDDHGTSAKGLAVRTGLFISAISHLSLAIWAITLLIGKNSASSQGSSSQGETFLQTDTGHIALGIAGLIIIGVGFAHMYKGWKSRFEKYMDIPADKSSWAKPICRFGLIARGVVWCIVGSFLIKSAMLAGDGKIKGIVEAMETLRDSPFGSALYLIVAAGLFAFGIYSLLEALYRRIEPGSAPMMPSWN